MTISEFILYAVMFAAAFVMYLFCHVLFGAITESILRGLEDPEFGPFSWRYYIGLIIYSAPVTIILEEKVPYIVVFLFSAVIYLIGNWMYFCWRPDKDYIPYKVKFTTIKILLDTNDKSILWKDHKEFSIKKNGQYIAIQLSFIDYIRYCFYLLKFSKGYTAKKENLKQYEQATNIITSILDDYINEQKKLENKYQTERVDILNATIKPEYNTKSTWGVTMMMWDGFAKQCKIYSQSFEFIYKSDAHRFITNKISELCRAYIVSHPEATIRQNTFSTDSISLSICDAKTGFVRIFEFSIKEVKTDVI